MEEYHAPFFSLTALLAGAIFMLAGCAAPAVVEKPLVSSAPVPRTAEPSTPPCGFHDKVVEYLARRYRETTVAVGVASVGGLVEVLASKGGETWTIIVTRPDGQACLVASGEGWRMADKPPAEGVAL